MEEYNTVDSNLVPLSSLVVLSEDAVISKNLNNKITGWNLSAERIFGFSREEAIGEDISILIPDDKKPEELQFAKLIKDGVTVNSYYTARLNNEGQRLDVMLSLSAILDSEGELIGITELIKDITPQRNSKERKEILAAIVDSAEDAIISKDLDGLITSWNQGAEKIFGYQKEEVLDKSIDILIPEMRRKREQSIFEKVKKGESVNHPEAVRLTKDGSELMLSMTLSPIKNQKGKIIGTSHIVRNVSDQVSINHRLKSSIHQLKLKQKDEFIGLAGHELKTPLTSIYANLQLLERKLDNHQHKGFVTNTIKHVNKLSGLVSELLDVTKIQDGKLQLNFSQFLVQNLLVETIENIQSTSVKHKIHLQNKCDVIVEADKQRIDQVLTNILNNAIKYSPHATDVIVNTIVNNSELIVSIQDFGIGISKNELEKIFAKFYRAEGLPEAYSGLGIGLYISSEIIQRHGGKIWAESELNIGSTFYFSLPITKRLDK